jgi:phosphoglycerol transferase MdoB-like AlkP superfamily enzyme
VSDSPAPRSARPADAALATGFGRLLLFVYGLFALAASARALVQIATNFSEAPLAYLLSGVAGLVYISATVGLAIGGTKGRRIALTSCSVELIGVLIVGSLSIADVGAFPDDTVWSRYGSGYGYVPLVLPFFGLWWIWSHRPKKPED